MKTSLGIWALGRTTACAVPAGRRAAREPVADRVHRAVAGLGGLIDGYEFNYPCELSGANLDQVRAALGPRDIHCVAGSLHLDPRFADGALTHPRPAVRSEARRSLCEAAEFAGSLGANLTVWLGIEGHRFDLAPIESSRRLIRGVGEAAAICLRHGVAVLLDHRSPEPGLRILRRNIGICLHVIQQLRLAGAANVSVSMDWQHLVMNGERLAQHATLLAAEGLLGHQRANSGWGHFGADEMVGAAAFMESLELAIELRRRGYGRRGERVGFEFDLDPACSDQIAAMRRLVRRWRYVESVATRVDDGALREARHNHDLGQARELFHAALAG
jgi:xylose isomerase